MGSDERDKTGRRQKAVFAGDVERLGRRGGRAPSSPIFEPDDEDTQPPAEPPLPEQLDGYGSLPPEVQIQLKALNDTLREQGNALARIWDTRHISDEVASVRQVSEELLKNAKILVAAEVPQLLRVNATQLQELLAWKSASLGSAERLERTLVAVDQRLVAVERDYVQLNTSLTGIATKITEYIAANTKDDEERDKEHKALELRVRALETQSAERGAQERTLKWAITAIAAVVSFVVGLAAHFIDKK